MLRCGSDLSWSSYCAVRDFFQKCSRYPIKQRRHFEFRFHTDGIGQCTQSFGGGRSLIVSHYRFFVREKPSLKLYGEYIFRCRSCIIRARVRTVDKRRLPKGKLEVKLNGAISDVQFKPSLKLYGEYIFRCRSCIIRARVMQRVRKREVSSSAHVHLRKAEKSYTLCAFITLVYTA